MCTYDTISKARTVGRSSIDTYRKTKSKALFLKYDEFDMSIEMYNVIPASNDLFIFVIVPIPSTNAKAMPNIDQTRVKLRFYAHQGQSGLVESGVSIKSSDISLRVNDQEEIHAKAIELLGKDRGSYENGIIKAYDNANVEIDFDLVWDPQSKYMLTIKEMIYKGSAITPPKIEFSKGHMTRSCDSAP